MDKPNLSAGDVVPLKLHKSRKISGLVVNAISSKDSKVHKVDVKMLRQHIQKIYSRPVSEVVSLV